MSDSTYSLFQTALAAVGKQEIANRLGIHLGTVKRWLLLKDVPEQYWFDFARILNIPVDYSSFSSKEKDQFFTEPSTAVTCYSRMFEILHSYGISTDDYTFIEPSVGDGSFYNLLPSDRRIGIDIESSIGGVIKQDFLTWYPDAGKYICIGNPPFGLRGHIALQFINKAAEYSDFVCFILPQLFNSNGKGNCKSRVKGLNLLHSEPICSTFHYPNGTTVNVNCIFQIWSKHYGVGEKSYDLSDVIQLLSLSDGGTPASTRNKAYHHKCDYYLPSTIFGPEAMRLYSSFDELPGRRGYGIIVKSNQAEIANIIESTDWSDVAFVSTNGAYNLRFDLITTHIAKTLLTSV